MTRDEPTHSTYPRGSGADTGLSCPQCGSTSLAANPSTGETVCEECGLVVEEGRAELGPEWYPAQEGRKRADVHSLKAPTMVKGGGDVPAWITTDTYIGNVNRGGGGGRRRGRSRMSPASAAGVDVARLRRAHAWLHAKEAAQRALYNRMRSVAATLRLPSATPAHAHQTYVDAANAGISFRGRGRDTVAVATTLAALRRLGAPQPHLREVRPLVRNMRATLRLYRRITEALSTRGGGNPNADTGADGNGGGSSSSIGGGGAGTRGGNEGAPSAHTEHAVPPLAARYLPQMCTALGLTPPECAEALKRLTEAAVRGYTSGKSPRALAAAAAYIQALTADTRRTEAKRGEMFKAALRASGVTPGTLRKAIHILGG